MFKKREKKSGTLFNQEMEDANRNFEGIKIINKFNYP